MPVSVSSDGYFVSGSIDVTGRPCRKVLAGWRHMGSDLLSFGRRHHLSLQGTRTRAAGTRTNPESGFTLDGKIRINHEDRPKRRLQIEDRRVMHMGILSWITNKKVEDEKRELRTALTQSIMSFEQRRGEVEEVARDVMKIMHRRSSGSEKT